MDYEPLNRLFLEDLDRGPAECQQLTVADCRSAEDNWPAELLTGQHDADFGAERGQ